MEEATGLVSQIILSVVKIVCNEKNAYYHDFKCRTTRHQGPHGTLSQPASDHIMHMQSWISRTQYPDANKSAKRSTVKMPPKDLARSLCVRSFSYAIFNQPSRHDCR